MPILNSFSRSLDYELSIWKIFESEEELRSGLKISSFLKEKLDNKKSLNHRKSILAIRQLLKKMNVSDQNQGYDDFGRPYLNDGRFISFSHSKSFACVVISDKKIGIDIEKNQYKILNISSKFLNDSEKLFLSRNSISQITQIWTAKEAVYKAFKIKGINFSEQIKVEPFSENSSEGIANIFYNNEIFKFLLFFYKINNYSATVAVSLYK